MSTVALITIGQPAGYRPPVTPIASQPRTTVVELLTEDVIGSFVTGALPHGSALLACCVLALLPAVGFQDEPGDELACLAAAFAVGAGGKHPAGPPIRRAL